MPRLPLPGGDAGNWGDILNEYLLQSHTPDGQLRENSVGADQLLDNSITSAQLSTSLQTTLSTAAGAVSSAASAASDALNAKNDAETARSQAVAAKNDAEMASTNALSARDTAASAQSAAENARDETIIAVGTQTNWTGVVVLTNADVSKPRWYKRQLTGNTTVSLASGASGKAYSIVIEIKQDATGGRTLTFSGVKWSYGVAPAISTTANSHDILTLTWTGTEWIGGVGSQGLAVPV